MPAEIDLLANLRRIGGDGVMEALLIMFMPLMLLWVCYALMTGRSIAPSVVIPRMMSLGWRLLRWLWRQRPPRGGAGRIRQPRMRYRHGP